MRVLTLLLVGLAACAEVTSGLSDAATDRSGFLDAPIDAPGRLDAAEAETMPPDVAEDDRPLVVPDTAVGAGCNDLPLTTVVSVVPVDLPEAPQLTRGPFRDGTYVLTRLERYRGGPSGPSPIVRASYTIRIRGNSLQLALAISSTPIGAVPVRFDFLRENFEIQTPTPFDSRTARLLCPDMPDNVGDVFYRYEQREDSLLFSQGDDLLFHFQRVPSAVTPMDASVDADASAERDGALDVLDSADRPTVDAASDVPGDWPVVVLSLTDGRDCNALRIHGIVNTIRRSEPFAETLSRGRMRDGVYHLTQVEHFPSPTAPALVLGVFGMTMRVVGTRVEFGTTHHVSTLTVSSGLRRYNCLLDERGAPWQCLYTCPESLSGLDFGPFVDYEATADRVRLWSHPYLYTLTWMGPP